MPSKRFVLFKLFFLLSCYSELPEQPSQGIDQQGSPTVQENSKSDETGDRDQNAKSDAIAIPCGSGSPATENDFVLFGFSNLNRNDDNTIDLPNGWRIEESWDNGLLEVTEENGGSVLRFSQEGQFHGFKFSPPKIGDSYRQFSFAEAQIIAYREKDVNSPVAIGNYGLRVIKPGEFEGAGGAPTTTWLVNSTADNNRFIDLPEDCEATSLLMPTTFLEGQGTAHRLIWEMQTNWNPVDTLVIKHIILKDFMWLN